MAEGIVVPLQDSIDSESVLHLLRSWGPSTGRIIILLPGAPGLQPRNRQIVKGQLVPLQQAASTVKLRARSMLPTADISVQWGNSIEEIMSAAAQEGAEGVLLGQGGASGRTPDTMGDWVARVCPKPVILARVPVDPRVRRPRSILVPFDAWAAPEGSLYPLRRLARLLRAELVLLQVRPGGSSGGSASRPEAVSGNSDADLQLRLIAWVWGLLKEGIAARSLVTGGSMAEEVLKHERWLDVDMVAIPRKAYITQASWRELTARCSRPVVVYDAPELPGGLLAAGAKAGSFPPVLPTAGKY
jgi:hypothetical protein